MSKKPNTAKKPPSTSSGSAPHLPPPTASETAFEKLLARFDRLDDPESDAAAAAQPTTVASADELEPAAPDDPDAFLAGLFARKSEFLGREPFARIGGEDRFNTKVMGVSF